MKNLSEKLKKKVGVFIDTSCPRGVVAVISNGNVLSEEFIIRISRYSEELVITIEKCLIKAKIKNNKLDFVCVGNGPGSFIGTRIAVSRAKGFCFGLGLKLFSINTLQALAASVKLSTIENAIVLVDAKRSEFFYVEFYKKNLNNKQIINFINSPKTIPYDKIQELCKNKQIIVGYGFQSKLNLLTKEIITLNGPTANGMLMVLNQKVENLSKCFDEIYSCKPNYCRQAIVK